jgi:hypothetical protein
MTEKLKELWNEIGGRWADISLSKTHDDYMRQLAIIGLVDGTAMVVSTICKTKKGAFRCFMVGIILLILNRACEDYTDAEDEKEFRAECERLNIK